MRKPTAVLALFLAVPAAHAETANLAPAIMVEWTVANCSPEGIPAMLVAASGMVIQAAPKEEAERIRGFMRQGTEANYPDKAAACADMKARIPR